MPYTRRRPLSLSRYGRARGRGRHLLVRVDAAGPPRPRSYKILQPVDGRRRTGGWWKRRISGWCPAAGWSRGALVRFLPRDRSPGDCAAGGAYGRVKAWESVATCSASSGATRASEVSSSVLDSMSFASAVRVVWVAKLPCDDRLLRRQGISDERKKQRDTSIVSTNRLHECTPPNLRGHSERALVRGRGVPHIGPSSLALDEPRRSTMRTSAVGGP